MVHTWVVHRITHSFVTRISGQVRFDRSRFKRWWLSLHPDLYLDGNQGAVYRQGRWENLDIRKDVRSLLLLLPKKTRRIAGNLDIQARKVATEIRCHLRSKSRIRPDDHLLARKWYEFVTKQVPFNARRKSNLKKDTLYKAYKQDGGRLSRVAFFIAIQKCGARSTRIRDGEEGRTRVLEGLQMRRNRTLARDFLNQGAIIQEEEICDENTIVSINGKRTPDTSQKVDHRLSISETEWRGGGFFESLRSSRDRCATASCSSALEKGAGVGRSGGSHDSEQVCHGI